MATGEVRVWAPSAPAVDIEIGYPAQRREPLTPDGDGWWHWDGDPTAQTPFDYAFVIDGQAHPDPRGLALPHGVNGPSRWFDPYRFGWTDDAWRGPRDGVGAIGGVLYELHVGTFTHAGTLDAAIARLDHLVDLGIDVVELMPLAPFPGRWGWGYDGVATYAVHDGYGGPEALQRFVDAAHARGLGVCLDLVYNHLGPSGNHLWAFGPYFTDDHQTPWGKGLNLDGRDNAEVRRWVLDNAVQWVREFHVDAFRLDAVHALQDDSPRHLLAELTDTVHALAAELGRPVDLIAESDLNDELMVTPTDRGGRGLDGQWDDDLHHALHVAATGEVQGYYADFGGRTAAFPDGGPMAVLATVLREVFLHNGRMSTFRGKVWGRPVDPTGAADRFVAYLQTHDQVGNRAIGDRISVAAGPARQVAAAALYLLSPYTAMLFMGEEWAASTPFAYFTSFDDPALAESVRQGRRREFATHGWREADIPDPQAESTRDACVLRWEERGSGDHARVWEAYRRLIDLRRTVPALASGRIDEVVTDFDEDARWLTMRRGEVHVVAAFGDHPVSVPAPDGAQVLFSLDGTYADGARSDGEPSGEATVRFSGPGVAVLLDGSR